MKQLAHIPGITTTPFRGGLFIEAPGYKLVAKCHQRPYAVTGSEEFWEFDEHASGKPTHTAHFTLRKMAHDALNVVRSNGA